MDKIDRKLLYELSKNSKAPLKELAKTVNRSPSTTARRIKDLKEDKTILGLHPIIDNSKLGYKGYRAYITFQGTTTNKEEEIFRWIQEQEEVSVLGETHGAIDALIMSWVKKADEFNKLIIRLKEKYRDKIKQIDAFVYLRTRHYKRAYLIEKEHNEQTIVTGESTKEKYDQKDLQLLSILIEDARIPALEIAQKINDNPRTTLKRLRKMENKGIIAGYGANLYLQRIGYVYYKINLVLDKNITYQTLLGYAQQLPNTIYVDETIGKYDFEINIEVSGEHELDQILSELKKLSGGFKEIHTFRIKKYHKLTYMKKPRDI